MRLVVQFLLPSILWMVASPAEAQEKEETQKIHFMRLTNPADTDRYGPGANCVVMGLLQSPLSESDIRSLWLRVRAYRPGKREFVIANESLLQMDKADMTVKKLATGEHRCTFQVTLELPKEQGKYVLRVDCLENKVTTRSPLIATQSLFIRVQTAAKREAKGNP